MIMVGYSMNNRVHPKLPAPSDEEILSYDNVPVDIAAQYLGWPENTVRLALREGRACFGTSIRDKGITHKISPGGLVQYKRESAPCMDYETMKFMMQDVIRQVIREELKEIAHDIIHDSIQAELAQLIRILQSEDAA